MQARARVTAINAELAALAPKVKAFNQVRHFEHMLAQAAAQKAEAAKALEALT